MSGVLKLRTLSEQFTLTVVLPSRLNTGVLEDFDSISDDIRYGPRIRVKITRGHPCTLSLPTPSLPKLARWFLNLKTFPITLSLAVYKGNGLNAWNCRHWR